MDIFSRYALGSLVEHSITGALAARHLEGLFLRYGAPRVLRRDNGPEFEAKVFKKMLSAWRVKDEPVPKAQPYDNGHLESFNGSLREELLDAELFSASWARPGARSTVGSTGITGSVPIRAWDIGPRLRSGRRPPLWGLRSLRSLHPQRGCWET